MQQFVLKAWKNKQTNPPPSSHTHTHTPSSQQYDAIQLKKELEKVQAENEEQRAEYKRKLGEEKAAGERARKKQRRLEKEKEDLEKKVQSANADNFAAFCTESPAGTPRMTPLTPAAVAATATGTPALGSPLRFRSMSVSTGPHAKSKSTLSQFII